MFWFIFQELQDNFHDFTAINNIETIIGSAIYLLCIVLFFPLRKRYLKLKLELLQKYTYLQLCIFLQKFRITQIVLCHFARRPRLQTMPVPFEKASRSDDHQDHLQKQNINPISLSKLIKKNLQKWLQVYIKVSKSRKQFTWCLQFSQK